MIEFDQKSCRDLKVALSREWLETNGIGGFSSSTISGLNTRRYHGLLIAATKPPVARFVLLSKLEETLVIDGRRYELSTNQYPGVIHPQGFNYQTGFRLDPFPRLTYEVEGVCIDKTVFMVQGENTTVIQYELECTIDSNHQDIRLEVRPLIAFRDYHSTTHENGALNSQIETDIIDWHVKGTRYQIHVDEDGLLFAGEPGVQLTWMDAKVGDWVVTPRHGKPVEIQALWYNALRVMEDLAERFNDPNKKQEYGAMANKARASFNTLFWNAQTGCLYDVINGELRDASIRPNQVIAISLANTMVTKDRATSILSVIERELLTPRGLRTLSPSDPNYIGRYEGGPSRRDGAYHQGTVWPWLMGPYISAYIKTFGRKAGRRFAAMWLENFQQHLHEACLGQVSEIFDGDAPYAPRGCVAQAWSVAELLRAIVEDIEQPHSETARAA